MARDPKGNAATHGRIGDVRVVKNLTSHHDARPRAGREDDSYWYAMRVQLPSGRETSLLLSAGEMAAAIERAHKNPEDVPHTGFVRDLLD
jgi:hypothetical protein